MGVLGLGEKSCNPTCIDPIYNSIRDSLPWATDVFTMCFGLKEGVLSFGMVNPKFQVISHVQNEKQKGRAFYTTQIPVSLWFLAKNKKQKGKTLFIDARKLGTMVTRKLRELTDEDIKKIADTYNAFVEGTLEDEKGFCAVVTTQDIAKQDYILTPGRYVGIEEQEDDDEPFEEKMGRLTSELSELFTKSHELEAQIKERLGAIGYGL